MKKIDNKSLLIGVAAGVATSALVFVLAFLIVNEKAKEEGKPISLHSIHDAPLKVIDKANADYKSEYNAEYTLQVSQDAVEVDSNEIKANVAELAKEIEKAEVKELPLYLKHAQTAQVAEGKKQIAIIIDDIGVNVEHSMYSADNLPKEITFSFLSHGKATPKLLERAQENKREAMLHLPTEPMGTISPGPNAIYANMTAEDAAKTTQMQIDTMKQFVVGVNNHMGSKFSQTAAVVKPVLETVEKNELFFMDSVTTAKTVIGKVHDESTPELPFLRRNVFLDHKQTEEFITMQLAKTERIADANGYAIAIAHPHKITTDVLNKWIAKLDKKNYQLVPISNILALKGEYGEK